MVPMIRIIQCLVALGLLNVWLLRFNRKTPYRDRGGSTASMREEFAAYGMPEGARFGVTVSE